MIQPELWDSSIYGAIFIVGAFMIIPVKAMHYSSDFSTAYLYVIMSCFTFYVYRYDKNLAQIGIPQLNENFLHLCGLFFGWPGALLGQYVFQHKIHEGTFQFIFWISGGLHQVIWLTKLSSR